MNPVSVETRSVSFTWWMPSASLSCWPELCSVDREQTKEGTNEGKEVLAHSQDSRPAILSGIAQKGQAIICSSAHNPGEGCLWPSPAAAPTARVPAGVSLASCSPATAQPCLDHDHSSGLHGLVRVEARLE